VVLISTRASKNQQEACSPENPAQTFNHFKIPFLKNP
jgi:hypothetical protein